MVYYPTGQDGKPVIGIASVIFIAGAAIQAVSDYRYILEYAVNDTGITYSGND